MNSPGNVRFVAAVLIGSAIEDAHVVDFSRLGSFAQHQRLHLLERRQRKYVRNRDHEELLPKPVTDMIRRVAVLRHLAHPAVRHEASNPTREKNGRESAPMTIPEAFFGPLAPTDPDDVRHNAWWRVFRFGKSAVRHGELCHRRPFAPRTRAAREGRTCDGPPSVSPYTSLTSLNTFSFSPFRKWTMFSQLKRSKSSIAVVE